MIPTVSPPLSSPHYLPKAKHLNYSLFNAAYSRYMCLFFLSCLFILPPAWHSNRDISWRIRSFFKKAGAVLWRGRLAISCMARKVFLIHHTVLIDIHSLNLDIHISWKLRPSAFLSLSFATPPHKQGRVTWLILIDNSPVTTTNTAPEPRHLAKVDNYQLSRI